MSNQASKPSLPPGRHQSRPTGALRPHPQAGLLPQLPARAYRALCEDIAGRGLQVPLEINGDDVVLDGHVRLQAARELDLAEVPVRIVAPPDEVEYLLLAALQHRQLSPSQRAALAAEIDLYRKD